VTGMLRAPPEGGSETESTSRFQICALSEEVFHRPMNHSSMARD
jgi:hypothetical protein